MSGKKRVKAENAILILANNMRYFELFIRNYPEELLDEHYQLIVTTETRIGDNKDKIKEILERYEIPNFKIYTSEYINETFKEEVVATPFVDDYTMSMNILSLWYVKKHIYGIKKILLIDDDVVLRKGVASLFQTDHHLFKSNRLSAGVADFEAQSENSKEIYREWFRIFDVEFSDEWWKEKYLKKYANSGQRLIVMNKFDLTRYEEKLIQFFESECFYWAWLARVNHISWYFDERFETLFFFDDLNDELKDSMLLLLTRPEKLTKGTVKKMLRSSIIHNATNSHKKKAYNFMIENGIIEGEVFHE